MNQLVPWRAGCNGWVELAALNTESIIWRELVLGYWRSKAIFPFNKFRQQRTSFCVYVPYCHPFRYISLLPLSRNSDRSNNRTLPILILQTFPTLKIRLESPIQDYTLIYVYTKMSFFAEASCAAWLLLFSHVYWSRSVFHIPKLWWSQLLSHKTSQSEPAKYFQNNFQTGAFLQSGLQRFATITWMSARFACENGCTTVSRFRKKMKFDAQHVQGD